MFNNVCILALDKRKDLWQPLQVDCEERGWSTRLFIVGDGSDSSLKYEYDWIDKDITVPPEWMWGTGVQALHHYKAHLSHKKILKMALKEDWPQFLLLEDDSQILDRADDILPQIELEINALCGNYDLIYFGWHCWEYENDIPVGTNLLIEQKYKEDGLGCLLRQKKVGGFHGVLINRSAYWSLLSLPAFQPLDSMVNNFANHLNRYICVPKVIDVVDTFSYCENRFVSRTPGIKRILS